MVGVFAFVDTVGHVDRLLPVRAAPTVHAQGRLIRVRPRIENPVFLDRRHFEIQFHVVDEVIVRNFLGTHFDDENRTDVLPASLSPRQMMGKVLVCRDNGFRPRCIRSSRDEDVGLSREIIDDLGMFLLVEEQRPWSARSRPNQFRGRGRSASALRGSLLPSSVPRFGWPITVPRGPLPAGSLHPFGYRRCARWRGRQSRRYLSGRSAGRCSRGRP